MSGIHSSRRGHTTSDIDGCETIGWRDSGTIEEELRLDPSITDTCMHALETDFTISGDAPGNKKP
jgi:hypothetical protein